MVGGGEHPAIGQADEHLADVVDDGNFKNIRRRRRVSSHDGDMVTWLDVRHVIANSLHHAGALVAEHIGLAERKTSVTRMIVSPSGPPT